MKQELVGGLGGMKMGRNGRKVAILMGKGMVLGKPGKEMVSDGKIWFMIMDLLLVERLLRSTFKYFLVIIIEIISVLNGHV